MTKFLYTLVFTLCVLCMNAQTLWTGASSNDWNDATNWTAGVPTSGQTATLPVMEDGNSPIYGGSPVIDFTIQNAGTLTFNTVVFNNGTIINFGGGIIINENYFINAGSMVFDNDGIFNNGGVFDNFGTYEHAASAELNNLGTFNSLGDLNSNGPINNEGTLIVSGKFITTQKLENSGTLTVTGFVDFPFGSELVNTTSGEIRIETNAKLQINSPLVNSGLLVNNGSFSVQSASVLTNTGIVRNNTNMELSGKFMNENNLVNREGLMIKSGGQLENKNNVNNQGEITMEICAILIQESGINIGGSIQTDGLTYEISGTANETNLEFGETFTDINETPSPQPACKSDNFFFLDESGIVEFTAADIDRGRSYGSCGAQLVEISVSPTSFTAADAGVRIVTLTVTDNLGRTSSCDDFVTIIPYVEPITATNSAAIDANCSADVTASTLPGANFTEVTFEAPVATSNCSQTPNTTVDCSVTPNEIPGLIFMGERNGSKYYCSNTNSLTWHQARDLAINLGGHLATVNDAEENEFIRNNILADYAWIGYNDEAQEGNFTWVSGSSDYTNWRSGEPNNSAGTEHFARILKGSGEWTDRNEHFQAEAVIEIPCPVVIETTIDCSITPNEITGLIYLGERNDSKYYCSSTNSLTWHQARDLAVHMGGHLATVNDAGENEFIRSNIMADYVWIGYNDEAEEGNFTWAEGNSSYTNWRSGEPNNSNGTEHFARLLKGSGEWTDRDEHFHAEAVIEIPCGSSTGGSTVCTLDNYGTEGNSKRIVWIQFDNEEYAARYETVGENTFQEFTDGTALLTGKVQKLNEENKRYSFSVKLENKRDYAQWTALGRLVKEEGTAYGDPTTWSYYELAEGQSTFIGEGDYAGEVLNLTHAPSDYSYGFQVGFGANVKDGSFGISGWWNFSGSRSGKGDFNADLNNCTIVTGGNGEVTVTQIQGIQSGGNFPVGTTQIAYRISDDCGNEEICLFDVVVEATPSALTLTNCSDDIIIDAPICEEGTTVTWDMPAATTTCYISDIIVDRVDTNPSSGDFFPIGTTTISYIVSDSCGNAEFCNFNIIVNEVEGELSVNCIDDITVTAARNETTAVANFSAPTGTTTGSGVTVRQLDGPESGDALAIGTYSVIFLISDDCNNTELCIFDITVEPTVIDDDNDGVPVDEDCDDNDASIPAAVGSACDDGQENTENDMIAADGCTCNGTLIIDADNDGVRAEEDCDDNDPSIPTTPGSTCDDGDATTENDVIAADGCSCGGDLIVDADNDGVRFEEDCDDNDPAIPTTPGTACDDGDATTENDVIAADGCSCGGDLIVDADNDGVRAEEDCDDNDPSVPAFPGTACDDNNALTENDVIGTDGCSCAGILIPTCTVDGGQIAFLDGSTEQTICADDNVANPLAVNAFGPIGANQQWVITDTDLTILGLPTAPPFNLEGAGAGTCLIWNLSFEDGIIGASVGANAGDLDGCFALSNSISVIRLTGADCPNFIVDEDGDGIAADEDCDDNDPSIPTTPGTVCDDANADTENDVILSDGCGCSGTPIVVIVDNDNDGVPAGEDCDDNDPSVPATPGTTCDDANASTENDIILADGCSCEGTPIVVIVDNDNDGVPADEDCDDNDPSVPATPGTACDDANADTENDVVTADGCGCEGTPIVTTGPDCADISIIPGDGSFTVTGLDGAPVTSVQCFNAMWQEEYKCFGDCDASITEIVTPGSYRIFVKYYTASYQLICTVEEVIEVGAGQPVDADNDGVIASEDCDDNDPSLPTEPGTTCDDGNADTENDVILANGCDCAGTNVNGPTDNDNDGVPADQDCDDNDPSVPATPGTACDDANADTENDVVTADGCGCAGTPIVTTGSDCANISIVSGNGSFTVTGLDGAPVTSVQCFNAMWQEEYKCFGDCDASVTEIVTPGSYRIFVKYYTAAYQLICTVEEVIEVTAGQPVDNDNDGVPASEDCDDNDPSVPVTPGTACDDANADTENDVILANGCDCAGTNLNGPTDNDNDGVPADQDCDDNDPSVPATPGTACDDANADTENDVVTVDGCGCAGTPIVTTGPDCADISIKIGEGSFSVEGLDGAPVTSVQCFNAMWQEEYKCFGDCGESITEVVAPGSYRIFVKYYTAAYQLICTIEEVIEVPAGPSAEVCTTRTASDVVNCINDVNYGGWLRITGTEYFYNLSNAELVEYADGTALLTGTWTNSNDSDIVFDIEIMASGKTTTAPANSPKEHRCLTPDTDAFYYYADFEGVLNGKASMEGAQIAISTFGAAFQLGVGANATGAEDTFGASAWFSGDIVQQPFSGSPIALNPAADGHLGDININLTGNVDDCDDLRSYAIAPNASYLHLNGTKIGSAVVGLDWISNNDYRTVLNTIERSENGADWIAIEETASLTQSTNATFYQTKDEQPALGVNQYRIKQQMNDGTFIYSNVVEVRFDVDPAKVVVYPNPTVEQLNISLVEYAGRPGTLTIANALGQQMHQVSFDEIPTAPVHIELDRAYDAGVYTIMVTIENRKPVTKLFIVSKL